MNHLITKYIYYTDFEEYLHAIDEFDNAIYLVEQFTPGFNFKFIVTQMMDLSLLEFLSVKFNSYLSRISRDYLMKTHTTFKSFEKILKYIIRQFNTYEVA